MMVFWKNIGANLKLFERSQGYLSTGRHLLLWSAGTVIFPSGEKKV